MTELHDAATALAEPVITHMAQIGDDGKWLKAHTIEHPSLLRQFEDAVTPQSAINDGGGSPALPSERSPVDLHMLLEFTKIRSEIRSWCHSAEVAVTRPPRVDVSTDLLAWLSHAEALEGFEGTFFLRRMRAWVALIRSLLEPAESFEADGPCPVCGSSGWGDMLSGGSLRPVLVSYRRDDSGAVSDERALCRACRAVWVGHESVMELAEEQHDRKVANNG